MLADGFIVRNTFIDVEHVLFDGDMLRLPRRPHSSPPSLAPFRPHSEPTTEVEVDEDDAVSQTISLEDLSTVRDKKLQDLGLMVPKKRAATGSKSSGRHVCASLPRSAAATASSTEGHPQEHPARELEEFDELPPEMCPMLDG